MERTSIGATPFCRSLPLTRMIAFRVLTDSDETISARRRVLLIHMAGLGGTAEFRAPCNSLAVHPTCVAQLSAMTQSDPELQRFLPQGAFGSLHNLRNLRYWRSCLRMLSQQFDIRCSVRFGC